ncbi:MAG: hypothetical protein JWO65_1474, partial [Sphingomonas bacterium]|nr:hypothetical protein [Sphingomonas bacterium]
AFVDPDRLRLGASRAIAASFWRSGAYSSDGASASIASKKRISEIGLET